jgi:hypothetical protein
MLKTIVDKMMNLLPSQKPIFLQILQESAIADDHGNMIHSWTNQQKINHSAGICFVESGATKVIDKEQCR